MAEEEHAADENIKKIQKSKSKTSILDNFSRLKNEQEKVRVKNGAMIVKYLKDVDTPEKDKNELDRTLVRLIRGLGSPLVSARAGYFSTLVVLLKAHDIAIEQLFEVYTKQLQTGGSNSKSEKADIYAGQILLWGATIHSGLFVKLTKEDQTKILQSMIEAGKKRSYLSLAAAMFIVNLFDQINESTFAKIIWPVIQCEVDKPWTAQSLDNVYLIFAAEDRFPKAIKSRLKPICVSKDLVLDQNLKALCTLLVDVPIFTTTKHPIYKVMPKLLVKSSLLIPFINEVDAHLIKPNRNRLIVMTVILREIMKILTDTAIIPDLLTTNFVKQTWQMFDSINGKRTDREFQQNVYELFNVIINGLKPTEVDSTTKIAVIKRFLFNPGTFLFEKITKSKLIQQIVSSMNGDGVKGVVEMYKSVVLNEQNFDSKDSWVNNNRIYAAQLLAKLLNHQSVQNETDWKQEQLMFLMNLSLTRSDDKCKVGTELAAAIKQTFFGALDLKFMKLNDICNLLSGLVHKVDSYINDTAGILREPLNDEARDVWTQSYNLITRIESKSKKSSLRTVFRFLFLQMNLQLLNDVKLAVDSLKELFSCYKKSKKGGQTDAIDDEESDPQWIEVVIELFLSLLSHKSHLLRSVVSFVFPHLCEYINESSLNQILSVLDTKSDSNPLRAEDESDSESDVDEGESDGKSDDDEVQDDCDDDNDDKEAVSDKLRTAVREALGGYQTDEESVDVDDMSEGEAERLDTALAEAFKQFKPNRGKNTKKQSKEDEALTHFRVRVLDLIEIYLDTNPKMFLCLQMIVPLLETLEFSIRDQHQKPLQDRISACLKKLANIKSFSVTDEVTVTVLGDLLRSLLEKGNKSSTIVQDMGDKIAECCVFVLRCTQILQSSEDTTKKIKKKIKLTVGEILQNELESYFKTRESLTLYVLFKTILPLSWIENVAFVPQLFNYIFLADVKQFRKYQAIELLKLFYLNHRLLSSRVEEISEQLIDAQKQFAENTVGLLNKSGDVQIADKFVCSLLSLLILIKKSPLKSDSINWTQVGDSIRTYRSNAAPSKDTRSAYNRLCNLVGVTNVVECKGAKPKCADGSKNENDQKEKAAKKKKRSKKESLKLKKEAQLLRMKSLSEGLSDGFSFASANLNQIEQMLDEEEVEGEVQSKNGLKRNRKSSENGAVKKKKVTST